jgi:hypothetical protein
MDIEIVRANLADTPEILELQKRAYQKEAILYKEYHQQDLSKKVRIVFMQKSNKGHQ